MNEKNIIVPKKEEILSWIQNVCDMGYRRPGSEADKKVENYFERLLREFGISDVRREDIEIPLWEPEDWKFFIEVDGKKEEIPCYFFVYTEFTGPEGITGELVAVQTGREVDFQKHDVKGKIAVIDFRNPPLSVGPLKKIAYHVHDPDNTLPDTYSHAATFRFLNWDAFYRAFENGAIGVIGILKDHPGGLKEYFYPADDTASDPRPIPGLYLGREEGKKLKKLLRENKDTPIKGTLIQKGKKSKGTTSNIMGIIPGKTDDIILVSSHHDAPFNNAVQDASGSGMVLALAKYFAQFPPKTFNKTLLFLFTAGHFYEEIGGKKFLEIHKNDWIPKIFTSIHIEHIAKECLEQNGELVLTGLTEPRAIFVSDFDPLVSIVKNAVINHDLKRSLILPTDNPLGGVPTEGGPFERENVTVISLASAPFYIYNPIDTMDKLAVEIFEPVVNAYIDIIRSIDKLTREDLK